MSTGDCWSVSCSPYRHRPVVQLPSAQQAQPGHCSGCKQCHPDTHSSPYTSNKQDISSLTRTHSWNLHFKHRWHEQKACFASFIIDAAMIKASSTLTRQGAEEILFWSSGKMSKPANKKNECNMQLWNLIFCNSKMSMSKWQVPTLNSIISAIFLNPFSKFL